MIFLCRHGQTLFNLAGRYQGRLDSPLTALGRTQASAMGRRLTQLVGADFKVWSSPQGRAQETLALILREVGAASVVTDARLREHSIGVWDGMTDFEIDMEYPGARDGLPQGEWHFRGPDAEAFEALDCRLAEVMAEISADPVAVKVVVTHGAVGRLIRGRHAGLGRAELLGLSAAQDGLYALSPEGGVEFVPC